MMTSYYTKTFATLMLLPPVARASIRGSAEYPRLRGNLNIYQADEGLLVTTEVWGLSTKQGECENYIFGLHIHEQGRCTGSAGDPFADAGGHYNPGHCPHPAHAGDMPPLFAFNGYAWGAFYTRRFTVDEVEGLSVIVHSQRDDFTSQPAGDSGKRIACGIIRMLR